MTAGAPPEPVLPEAPPVQMAQYTVTIRSTGRPVIVTVPVDLTVYELAEFAGWALTELRSRLEDARGRPSRIVVPR